MNQKRKSAIDFGKSQLVDYLEKSVESLMDYLEKTNVINSGERDVVKCQKTEQKKTIDVLQLLTVKDHGWEALISYLCSNNQKGLAEMILKSADETIDPAATEMRPNASGLYLFSLKLAEYYQANSRLWTLFRNPKHVEDVWVPLEVAEYKESGENGRRLK